jgi:hypothetical protein
MGPIGCPKTSVRNYLYSLRDNPEERSSQPLRGGRLESRKIIYAHKSFLLHIRQRYDPPLSAASSPAGPFQKIVKNDEWGTRKDSTALSDEQTKTPTTK